MNKSISGVTMRRIPAGLPGAGVPVVRLHYTCDPTLTPERIAALKASYSSLNGWQKEMEILYEAFEGELMFPEYQPERNDCDPFDVSDPDHWSIWMACDPHMRTPHAFGYEAFNEEGDRVVCGELWPDMQYTVQEYTEWIKWVESDAYSKPSSFDWSQGKRLRVVKRFMDTHGSAANSDEGGDFFNAYRNHGIVFYPALKGQQQLAAARDIIGQAFLPNNIMLANGEMTTRPLRRIFRTCIETRLEYSNVRFPPGEVERPGQERPKTYRKHLIDCFNYIQTGRPCFIRQFNSLEDTWRPIYEAANY